MLTVGRVAALALDCPWPWPGHLGRVLHFEHVVSHPMARAIFRQSISDKEKSFITLTSG